MRLQRFREASISASNLKSKTMLDIASSVSKLYSTLGSCFGVEFLSNIDMQFRTGSAGMGALTKAADELKKLTGFLVSELDTIHDINDVKSAKDLNKSEFRSDVEKLENYITLIDLKKDSYSAVYTFGGAVGASFRDKLTAADLVYNGRKVKCKAVGSADKAIKLFKTQFYNCASFMPEAFKSEIDMDLNEFLRSDVFIMKEDKTLFEENNIKLQKVMSVNGLGILFTITIRVPFKVEEFGQFTLLDFDERLKRFKKSLKEYYSRKRNYNMFESVDFKNLPLDEEIPLLNNIVSGMKDIFGCVSFGKIKLADIDKKLTDIANSTAMLNIMLLSAKQYFTDIYIDGYDDDAVEYLEGYHESLVKAFMKVGKIYKIGRINLKTAYTTDDIIISCTQKLDEPLSQNDLVSIYKNSGKGSVLASGRAGETGNSIFTYSPTRARMEGGKVVFVADSETYDFDDIDKSFASMNHLPGKKSAVAKLIISKDSVTIEIVSSSKA